MGINVIDLLLKSGNRKLPEKSIKLKKLSEELGTDVIFKLRALPYNEVARLKEKLDEMNVNIVLNGVIEPDLRSTALMQKYDAPTPLETIKAMLLPGEIEDISREIERLSGFRVDTIETIEEIKKK